MTTKEAEIVSTYELTKSISSTARHCNLSEQKVRKILITSGVELESARTRKILEMHESGQGAREISETLGIGPGAVCAHLPYTKGIYGSATPTENALAIRKHRDSTAAKRKGAK